jgi:putative oxidoreductase
MNITSKDYAATLGRLLIGFLFLLSGLGKLSAPAGTIAYIASSGGLFTIVTALAFHHPLSDQNQFIHFFKNISIAGGMLQVAVFGAGALSIDGWLARKQQR